MNARRGIPNFTCLSCTCIYFLQVIHSHAHQRTQMSESLQIAEKEGCYSFEDASSAYRNHYYCRYLRQVASCGCVGAGIGFLAAM